MREVFAGLRRAARRRRPGRAAGADRRRPPREFLQAVGSPGRPSWAGRTWPGSPRSAIPALNYGPGDPNLAHKQDEQVEIPKIREGAGVLRRWLAAG